MEPKIIEVPTFQVAGLQTYGGAMSPDFAKMWSLLMDSGLEIPDRIGEHVAYGVCSYIPASQTKTVAELSKTACRDIAALVHSLGRQPTVEELAAKLGVSAETAESVLQNLPQTFSLDEEAGETTEAEEMRLFYMAAVPVSTFDNTPPNVVGKIIPANTYAVFAHKGVLDSRLKDTFYAAYTWLAGSEYERASPYDFERYGEDFQGPQNPDSILEIYVPVKKKS